MFCGSSQQHAWSGLAAGAGGIDFVRAKINGVEAGTCSGEFSAHFGVNLGEISWGNQTFCNSPLIGDHDS